MKTIYITSTDTNFIYNHLKGEGYYDWFIILKCVEEMQCDYSFLSTLSWSDILYNTEITDAGGGKYATYEVPVKLKEDVQEAISFLNIDDLDQFICGDAPSITAKELHKQLSDYECIKQYQSTGYKFRIDTFGQYRVDKDGSKIYGQIKIDPGVNERGEEKIQLHSIYVAKWADKFADQRPEGFELKFYDKKIGVAGNVDERMKALSVDKRSGGTKSPMYIKALRAWRLPIKECLKLESTLHKYFDDRRTDGEWFTDYYEDLIEHVELIIQEVINGGVNVVELDITKENEDVTFLSKKSKDFWYFLEKQENVDDGPMIYEI